MSQQQLTNDTIFPLCFFLMLVRRINNIHIYRKRGRRRKKTQEKFHQTTEKKKLNEMKSSSLLSFRRRSMWSRLIFPSLLSTQNSLSLSLISVINSHDFFLCYFKITFRRRSSSYLCWVSRPNLTDASHVIIVIFRQFFFFSLVV